MDVVFVNKTKKVSSLLKLITKWFVFFGPIGTLIPVPFLPHSFRFYYLLLPIGIILFVLNGVNKTTIDRLVSLSPILYYMFVSASIAFLNSDDLSAEYNPLFRVGLLFYLLFFTLFSGYNASYLLIREKMDYITLYIKAYFLSMIVGYFFHFGYYYHVLSLDFIGNFEILTQFGAGGLLRFSPGSYPNEYGNVSSFVLAILTLLFLNRKLLKFEKVIFNSRIKRVWFYSFYLMCSGALFLTTTRSAYVSFILSVVYIILSEKNLVRLVKNAVIITSICTTIFIVVQTYFYDIVSILKGAYTALFNEEGSAYARIVAWEKHYNSFVNHPLFGTGFATASQLHNTYLQFIFELGAFGTIILFLSLSLFCMQEKKREHIRLRY